MAEFGKEYEGELVLRTVPDADALIQAKLAARGWLPVVYDPDPAIDPDTHYIQLSGAYTVGQSDVTRHKEVVERTAEDKKQIADEKQKAADYAANLPSWAQVKAAIANAFPDAAQKNFMTKMARVVYWIVKNDSE